ncbi:MAG: S-layer homology domain-containing protein [Candidatus Ancillula sp.]|jgi:acid stress-induced BolA-like protein IbaG/YrbA|nr:S-layer homology domain-containing protein [Candidatus Ancillula sp.]
MINMDIKKTLLRSVGALSAVGLAVVGTTIVTGITPDKAYAFASSNTSLYVEGSAYDHYEKTGLVTTNDDHYASSAQDGNGHVRFGDTNTGQAFCTEGNASDLTKVNNGFTIDIKLYKAGTDKTGVNKILEVSGTSANNTLKLSNTSFESTQYIQVLCRSNSYKTTDGEGLDLKFVNVPGLKSLENSSSYPVTVTIGNSTGTQSNDANITVHIIPTPLTLPAEGASVNLIAGETRTISSLSGYTGVTSSNKNVEAAFADSTLTLKGVSTGVSTITLVGSSPLSFKVYVHRGYEIPTVDLSKVVLDDSAEDKQFKTEITDLFNKSITTGVHGEDGKVYYYGDHYLTRGQLAAFLYRAAGSPAVSAADLDDNFADSKGTQFAKEIAWLKAFGVATGVDGKYFPNADIKRGELAKLIVNALSLAQIKTAGEEAHFTDVASSNQFFNAIQLLQELKIVNGVDGKFYPDNNITRGQVAKIISKALHVIENDGAIPVTATE